MKAALKKVGSSDASSNALQNTDKEQWRDPRSIGKRKIKYSCVVYADEYTRPRLEGAGHKPHQDQITAKETNSVILHSLVHKFIPMPQAYKIPDAKAAVEKECEKLEKKSAWNLTKVRSKKEVIDEARTKGEKVNFTSLMDICHLKNAELEDKAPKIQRSSCTPRRHRER